MKHLFLTILCALGCSGLLQAQIDHAALLQDYYANDFSSWRAAIDQTDANDLKALREIINYEYGYIGVCLGAKKEDEAKKYIAVMQKHLDKLKANSYPQALVQMYQSAICAFELSMDHWKFATLGYESVRCADKAYELAPTNPFVLSLKGNTDFYRPSIAGGSKTNAIAYYEKAVAQYEQQQLTMYWNYPATLLTLAQAYEKTGNLNKAKAICQKLLKLAPNFKYVRDIYYPSLLKKQ